MKLTKLQRLIRQRDGLNKLIADEEEKEAKLKKIEEDRINRQEAAHDEYKRIADGIRLVDEDAGYN